MGEAIACEYLRDKKWRVLFRNDKKVWGELDIVARDPKGVLVMVEVKTLKGDGEVFKPEDNYSFKKAYKTQRAALAFANSHRELVKPKRGFRIDLIAVLIKNEFADTWQEGCEIRHYENVIKP